MNLAVASGYQNYFYESRDLQSFLFLKHMGSFNHCNTELKTEIPKNVKVFQQELSKGRS